MRLRTLPSRLLMLSSLCFAAQLPSRAALAQSDFPARLDPEIKHLEGISEAKPVALIVEGFVNAPGGAPAAGAVVVSSAGGQAVTDANGEFRLKVQVPREARSMQVTAVGGSDGKLVTSKAVLISGATGSVSVPPLQLTQGSTCSPSWLPTFGGEPGANDYIYALTVFDDGNGPALYAGGKFTAAGGVVANRIARWDGADWTALGTGMNIRIWTLTTFDDGNGAALYAGGDFTTAGGVAANRIAKWDGTNWTALGTGMDNTVFALTVFDDGNGLALYAGGRFATADGVATSSIAKWNGSSWAPLGAGITDINRHVRALTVFDDGNGPALYAGGNFLTAGGLASKGIAKWDGVNWAALGTGVNHEVFALTVFDDGNGPALYAGGTFGTAGGVAADKIAKWDGSSWSALGTGLNGTGAVWSLTSFDDGNGLALYAGGSFWTGVGAANNIAKWGGSSWAALGTGTSPRAQALTVFDDGNGPALFAGGRFTVLDSVAANNIAKWDGSSWAPFSTGHYGPVRALAIFDDGGGPALYAAGNFTGPGGVAASKIAKWDGSNWAPLGTGITDVNREVRALAVFDDGNGPALYAAGSFDTAGGVAAISIARWDGSNWTAVGNSQDGNIFALAGFDDGNGPALYAGGLFAIPGPNPGDIQSIGNLRKWDGISWTVLDVGIDTSTIYIGVVRALTVFDDGSGSALYAGGSFPDSNYGPATLIARLDGSNWTVLGTGITGGVSVLTAFDDGNGSALYAGGSFTAVGSVAANNIAKWDGTSWMALGPGISSSTSSTVWTLAEFDDGSGPALYVGGEFTTAGGGAANNIAKWDGSSWTALGSGMSGDILALATFDDGGGTALFAGGSFLSALDSHDSYLAKWAGCPPVLGSDLCNGDGGDQLGCTDCPCMNNAAPGTIGGCLNSGGTACRLAASGDSSASTLPGVTTDLRFTLSGAPSGAFGVLLSGSAVAPQNPLNSCIGMESGVQSPDRDGLRCAVVNLKRHGGRAANAAGEVLDSSGPSRVWGGEAQPNGGIWQQGGFVAGQTRYFQVTFREDSSLGCMRGLNTSQAIEIAFTP